jgi:mRNA deadenylase 3'-5' endonuclease subunit Ccr4
MLVVNTHIHWNPKLDFVKYGQSFWLLLKISEFLEDNDISLETVPLVICGDFNSTPQASTIHMMLNKDYKISDTNGRAHYRTGVKAYRSSDGKNIQNTEGYKVFQKVK